jgi:hypothetical protein
MPCVLIHAFDAATETHLRTERLEVSSRTYRRVQAWESVQKPGQMESAGAAMARGAPLYASAVS